MSEEKMRKIKFRAWDRRRKKWADYIEIYEDGTFNIAYGLEGGGLVRAQWEESTDMDILGEDKFGKWNYDRDCVLMQFTSLLDKNGKEIYEGDIVRFQSIFGVVEYTKDCAFEVMRKLGGYGSSTIEEGEPLSSQYEIIGDIYQNPELLEDSHAKNE